MVEKLCQFRQFLAMFTVMTILTVLTTTISANSEIRGNILHKVMDNDEPTHHNMKRSVSKTIGNLQIQRNGSYSITVSHNGRRLYYNGREIVNGMLQEFFSDQSPASSPKPITDSSSVATNSRSRYPPSSSYTSPRGRSSKSSFPAKSPARPHSFNTDSNSNHIPDSKKSNLVIPRRRTVIVPSKVTRPPVASQPRSLVAPQQQRTEPNSWREVGHGPAPPPPLPRKPYVEYFTMMRIPGVILKHSGQRFSGYAFHIKDEDRLLFPQYGQQHLKVAPGLERNPSFVSNFHGPKKTLEFISEAIISGMQAQYFGIKPHRRS